MRPALLPALLVGALGACAAPAPELAGPNRETAAARRVVLVLVDTLRADHLPVYGYPRDTAPVLTERAAQARVFTEARSPAPWTLPAARALLGADRIRDFEPETTVPVMLDEAGWRTVLLAANPNISAPFGFHAGWDRAELHEHAPAQSQVDRALAELATHPDHLFVLLHLMDPHLPYAEPPALRHRFAGEAPSDRLADPIHGPALAAALAATPITPAERDHLRDRYDQTILAVDQALARLWSALDDNDLVIVVSDHGESLGEDGQVGHGHSLDEALVRVPLLVWGPGVQPGRTEAPVGLDDVGATVLHGAGLAPGPARSGRDLRGALGPDRPQLLSHTHFGRPRFGVVAGKQRWVTEGAPLGADFEAAWEQGGGAPLVSVVQTSWTDLPPHETPEAAGSVTGLQLRVPGHSGAPWSPPAPLQAPPAVAAADAETWQLQARPLSRLPGVVCVPVGPERSTTEDLRVLVQQDGTWRAPAPGTVHSVLARVPPAVPAVVLGPPGP